MRVFACSDLHVDYPENRTLLRSIPRDEYREDVLLVAGDVTDDLMLLTDTLGGLKQRFARVFFVPGNHELWDRDRRHDHAVARFDAVLDAAARAGAETSPGLVERSWGKVRIVPLFSWYRGPGEGEGSLFLPHANERWAGCWTDERHVRWPPDLDRPPADYFLERNRPALVGGSHPVVTLSHFLPRRELMFSGIAPPAARRRPGFNFSRVAGCGQLDAQIRRLNSSLHVYGHQHRNRDRVIDGIRYVSHCLGYPRERQKGIIDWTRPYCVAHLDALQKTA